MKETFSSIPRTFCRFLKKYSVSFGEMIVGI